MSGIRIFIAFGPFFPILGSLELTPFWLVSLATHPVSRVPTWSNVLFHLYQQSSFAHHAIPRTTISFLFALFDCSFTHTTVHTPVTCNQYELAPLQHLSASYKSCRCSELGTGTLNTITPCRKGRKIPSFAHRTVFGVPPDVEKTLSVSILNIEFPFDFYFVFFYFRANTTFRLFATISSLLDRSRGFAALGRILARRRWPC